MFRKNILLSILIIVIIFAIWHFLPWKKLCQTDNQCVLENVSISGPMCVNSSFKIPFFTSDGLLNGQSDDDCVCQQNVCTPQGNSIYSYNFLENFAIVISSNPILRIITMPGILILSLFGMILPQEIIVLFAFIIGIGLIILLIWGIKKIHQKIKNNK